MRARIPALFLAALLCGCVANNTQSLVILQNNVPEVSEGACVAPGQASSLYRGNGTLDVSLVAGAGTSTQAAGYLMFPVVQNNLDSSVAGTSVTIDPNTFNIQLSRVDVEVTDAGTGRPLGSRFSVPVYKVIAAGGSAGLVVDVLPYPVMAELGDASMVMVKLTVVGERDGGQIKSNTMEYAITVCDGCLFDNAGACVDFTGTGSVNQCNIAQDQTAVCCEHSTKGLICPAVAETTTG
jgi:hypothetical protein